MPRCYHHYCPVAHSLDLVGERWALLVVRELLNGPKRYTDLLDGLSGIGTNILAARLRDLEQAGVVRRTKLPPPAASTVYELTEYGLELREVVYALGRWGARSLGPPAPEEALAAGWLLNALPATFDERSAGGVTVLYELRAGDEIATVQIADGALAVAPGPADTPDAVIRTDAATLFRLVSRELDVPEAVAEGRVEVEGDADALETFVSLFRFSPRDLAAVS